MNDNRAAAHAQRGITAGWIVTAVSLLLLFAGGLNVFDRLRAGRTPEPLPLVLFVLGAAALVIGAILLIDGWTARWQAEMKNRGDIPQSLPPSRFDAALSENDAAPPAASPGDRGAHSGYSGAPGPIPGRRSLEQPATKTCPACAKAVYKDARVCRFCGHAFGVSLRLKVYPPEDTKLRERVVALLAKKLKMPPDETAHLLDLGMRFRYDSPEKLAAARARFESLGCRTEVYEKAGRE
jgi:hypothetical protein